MQTLESLNKKIKTANDLLSVVKTMKSLAAVSIRQYERAVESLDMYCHVVDMGWQVFFRKGGPVSWESKSQQAACLLLGSDQGMCGQFNDALITRGLDEVDKLKAEDLRVSIWGVGEKVIAAVTDMGHDMDVQFSVPGSLSGINTQVQAILQEIDAWRTDRSLEHFYICHNIISKAGTYEQTFYRLLPLDKEWSIQYIQKVWPTRCLPMMNIRQDQMLSHLLHQYLFVSLFRAFAQSLAGENAARLMAMQAAEKNILETQDELMAMFRELRQTNITNELLDIVSGFEALGGAEG